MNAKVDPVLCRELAAALTEQYKFCEEYGYGFKAKTSFAAIDQLSAAADLAERPALTEERVREVVRDAADALLDERKLYIVKPQTPTMNEIVLEAYGHGRACDAVALQGDDLQAVLTEIATRAAKELAGATVALNDQERAQLGELLGDGVADDYPAACQAIDRLLSATPSPPPSRLPLNRLAKLSPDQRTAFLALWSRGLDPAERNLLGELLAGYGATP